MPLNLPVMTLVGMLLGYFFYLYKLTKSRMDTRLDIELLKLNYALSIIYVSRSYETKAYAFVLDKDLVLRFVCHKQAISVDTPQDDMLLGLSVLANGKTLDLEGYKMRVEGEGTAHNTVVVIVSVSKAVMKALL